MPVFGLIPASRQIIGIVVFLAVLAGGAGLTLSGLAL
jgi:hypothetical protein